MGYQQFNTRPALVSGAENVATLLAGALLTSIDAAVRADLLTLVGTLPADLAAANATIVVDKAQAESSVSAANAIDTDLSTVMQQVFDNLKAGRAPKEQFDLCGFSYPFAARVASVPVAPTDLSGLGSSNGVNKLKFKGNNKSGSVTYEMFRRSGDTADWAPHGITRSQIFIDSPVTPGQYYEYKVRAAGGKNQYSEFSGTVVIYGTAIPVPPTP